MRSGISQNELHSKRVKKMKVTLETSEEHENYTRKEWTRLDSQEEDSDWFFDYYDCVQKTDYQL